VVDACDKCKRVSEAAVVEESEEVQAKRQATETAEVLRKLQSGGKPRSQTPPEAPAKLAAAKSPAQPSAQTAVAPFFGEYVSFKFMEGWVTGRVEVAMKGCWFRMRFSGGTSRVVLSEGRRLKAQWQYFGGRAVVDAAAEVKAQNAADAKAKKEADAEAKAAKAAGAAAHKKKAKEAAAAAAAAGSGGGGEGRIVVAFTGIEPAKGIERVLQRIGATLTGDVPSATHLICGGNGVKLKRTVKLLIGICSCTYLLDEKWLDAQPADQFLMRDAEAEKKWAFTVPQALERRAAQCKDVAREAGGGGGGGGGSSGGAGAAGSRRSGGGHGQEQCALLHGYRVYITGGKILPPKPELEKMVRAAGGTCEKKKPAVAAKDLLVVSAKDLKKEWEPLTEEAQDVGAQHGPAAQRPDSAAAQPQGHEAVSSARPRSAVRYIDM
jgi:hypothetical protein